MENLEKTILETANKSISEAIVKNLTDYSGPLRKLCEKVISDNESTLYSLINTEFQSLLTSKELKKELKSALDHKFANLLISKLGGELEKRVNELRADPSTRARFTVAIEDAINNLNK